MFVGRSGGARINHWLRATRPGPRRDWLWEQRLGLSEAACKKRKQLHSALANREPKSYVVRVRHCEIIHLAQAGLNRVIGQKVLLRFGLLLSLLCACSPSEPPRFDGRRAFLILQEQCDFGPRYPGSEGHRKVRQYLLDKLSLHTDFVKTQNFVHWDPDRKVELHLTNIIASFYPDKHKRMLLCTHWDTRPIADRDPDTSLRSHPVPGGNDGASGVSVLLEIAGIISQHEPNCGVDIVLFDGEDGGREEDLVGFCLGSDYFVANSGDYRPEFGILVDMIGDKNLKLYKEGHSYSYAREYVELVWSKARGLGLSCFNDSVGHFIYDDHVPFLNAGIPVIDLIDLDYPYWHTTSDTPDKCSPESLQKIGDVLLEVLYKDP